MLYHKMAKGDKVIWMYPYYRIYWERCCYLTVDSKMAVSQTGVMR